jgi:hypothetical protein
MGQLSLGKPKEKIGLILVPVLTAKKGITSSQRILDDAGIVPRSNALDSLIPSPIQKDT